MGTTGGTVGVLLSFSGSPCVGSGLHDDMTNVNSSEGENEVKKKEGSKGRDEKGVAKGEKKRGQCSGTWQQCQLS